METEKPTATAVGSAAMSYRGDAAPALSKVSTCGFKGLTGSVDVAGGEVGPGLSPYDEAGVPVACEDDRDPPVAVVVVGHREAVGPGRGDGEQVVHRRGREGDPLHKHVAALTVPAHNSDPLGIGPVEAAHDSRLEALPEQRHLEVVAHPAVNGDEGDRPTLDGVDAVDRRRRLADHAATRLDDHLRLRGQVLLRGVDEGVEVGADRGWVVGPRVAGAETTARS